MENSKILGMSKNLKVIENFETFKLGFYTIFLYWLL